jgi:hypothetical protein
MENSTQGAVYLQLSLRKGRAEMQFSKIRAKQQLLRTTNSQ